MVALATTRRKNISATRRYSRPVDVAPRSLRERLCGRGEGVGRGRSRRGRKINNNRVTIKQSERARSERAIFFFALSFGTRLMASRQASIPLPLLSSPLFASSLLNLSLSLSLSRPPSAAPLRHATRHQHSPSLRAQRQLPQPAPSPTPAFPWLAQEIAVKQR